MNFSGRTVIAVIEFTDNKILLIKRSAVAFKGYWALPGGRVDPGETVEQAVIREIKEKTGLIVKIVRAIRKYHEFGVYDGIEYDYYTICFLVKPVSGRMKRQRDEIEAIKLFDFKAIPEKLAFQHKRMIEDYLRILDFAKIDEEIRKCVKCRLHETRMNAVPGEGPTNAKIMICGQAPGRTEDRLGRPFVGMAGKFLDELLSSAKINRKRIFITSPIKCFPPNNRVPKSDESEFCKPYLDEQIRIIKPKIIIALGNFALQTLLDKKLTISKIHGEPQNRSGTIIFPTFHPAAAMRFPKIKALMKEDFKKLEKMERYIIN